MGGQALEEGSEGTRSLKRGRAHAGNSAICTPPRSWARRSCGPVF